MSKLRALAIVLAVAAAAGLVTPHPAAAGPGPGGGQPNSLKVEGTVSAVNAATGQVAITTRAGATVVVVAGPTTKVERNGRRATLAAFRVGDRGEAVYAPGGAASKIEAVGP